MKNASFPTDGGAKNEIESAVSQGLQTSSKASRESGQGDENTIHVDEHRLSKVYSGTSRYESTENLALGDDDEQGYSAPILASDEVAKEPWGYELQPAVSPLHERRSGHYEELYRPRSGSGSTSNSRPPSRPGSIHGSIPGLRVQDSTPLEDLDEYEPLFPEDEKKTVQKKPLNAADRLRQRPELKNRKFPSQDVWEDTPDSLQYTATVSTPQSADDSEEAKHKAARVETPEQAFARRQEELAEKESVNTDSFLHREQKKKPWQLNLDVKDESRPNPNKRFPSRDVWEDTPDSHLLETTVSAPQIDDHITSPADERPTTGAVVYHQELAAAGVPLSSEEGRATTGIAATLKPQVPSRPARTKLSESPEKAQPVIPERRPDRSKPAPSADLIAPPVPLKTKPQVPARPSKPVARDSSETVPLTTVASNSSSKSVGSDHGIAAASKPKPPVPTRPVGGKIAALQGGFMSDLNKRLQLGPQAPKKDEPVVTEQEEVKEKAPLVDARKGRARGPARRAPAKSPAPIAEPSPEKSTVVLGFSTPSTLWEIDPEENTLQVGSFSVKEETQREVEIKVAHLETPTLATNTAGESLHDIPGALPGETSPAVDDAEEETKIEIPEKTKISIQEEEETSDVVAPPKSIQESVIPDDEIEIESEPAVVPKVSLAAERVAITAEDDMIAPTSTINATEQ